MRKQIEASLKNALRGLAISERDSRGLTQAQMAGALLMSERSYSDIECGESGCGTLTAILLLMSLSDPNSFLKKLKHDFESCAKEGVTI